MQNTNFRAILKNFLPVVKSMKSGTTFGITALVLCSNDCYNAEASVADVEIISLHSTPLLSEPTETVPSQHSEIRSISSSLSPYPFAIPSIPVLQHY